MRFDRRARDRQDTQDHELGQDFSARSQRGRRRRKWSYRQKVAHHTMLRAMLAVAVVLLPSWLIERLIGTRFVILAGVVTVAVMEAAVVMAAVLTGTGITLDGTTIGGVVLFALAMGGAMAMIVPRRCDGIGEQIARQHDPDRNLPNNAHRPSLDQQIHIDLHNPTSLRRLPLECNLPIYRGATAAS